MHSLNTVDERVFLHHPIGPPLLTPVMSSERAGLFTVDLSKAVPRPASNESDGSRMSPVVFLFKMEEKSSHNISYIWMVRMKACSTILF